MSTFVLTGAHIKLYINNKLYKSVQGISFQIDYGETETYGIDSLVAQEIAPTKLSVKGKITGIRIKNSGGLQAHNIRPLYTDLAASPYISIRIQDRQSGEDILFIPKAKATNEQHQIGIKSTYKLSFDFLGILPLTAIDRS